MAELVVIGYPDEATAKRALETVTELQEEFIIELAGAAVVTRSPDGKLNVEAQTQTTAAGAAMGALWGALIGLLFFVPLGGLLIGGLFGAVAGKLTELGIEDSFRERVQEAVKPGMSALVLVYTKITPDKALEALAPLGGQVLKTSLSEEAEAEFQRILAGKDSAVV